MALQISRELAENYAEYYRQGAPLTAWRRLGAIDKSANIMRLCSQLKHETVLEVGCGDGAVLERLSELGFGARFTGLEISSSAVRSAGEKDIPSAEIMLFDGYELPFPPDSFDLAILTHVLEHVEHPRKLINEAARVAKRVFVEVPLEENCRLSNDFEFDTVGHINFYNKKTIRRLVQSCNMRILDGYVSHSSVSSYVYRKGRFSGRLSHAVKEAALRCWPSVAPSFFTYHYSLVYKKAD